MYVCIFIKVVRNKSQEWATFELPLFQNESSCETIHTETKMLISCKSNSFSYEWFCTTTRFDTKANGNSKVGHS